MKKFRVKLPITLAIAFLFFSGAFAAPDPQDSIIIESKTIQPAVGAPAAVVRVYITNRDSIANLTVPLVQRSLTGGAYMTLARPRTFTGVIQPLTATLHAWTWFNGSKYNSVSPDTFLIAGMFDTSPETIEPPNAARKAIWEIKFDTVWSNAGTMEFDSVKFFGNHTVFVDPQAHEKLANFVKRIITVASPPPCGDVNGDGQLTTYDLVQALNCVFFGVGNCGRISTPSGLIRLLNAAFRESADPPLPC